MSKGRRTQSEGAYGGLSKRMRILLFIISIIIILAMVLGLILPFVGDGGSSADGG